MKRLFTIIIFFFCLDTANAKDAQYVGSFLGELPLDLSQQNWTGAPAHLGAQGGYKYLSEKNISFREYVYNAKNNLSEQAVKDGKFFAERQGKANFAITNITYQVVHSEVTIEVYTDFYIVAW
jgi:hypothetical protein